MTTAHGATGGKADAGAPAASEPAETPAVPKPKSRRGYMMDSPLDGGSGWQTGAYAIVPRPAPPADPPTVPTQTPQQPSKKERARNDAPRQASQEAGAPRSNHTPSDTGAARGAATTVPVEASASAAAPTDASASAPAPTHELEPDEGRRVRALALSGLVLLLVALAVGLGVLWSNVADSSDRSGADPTPTAAGPAQGAGGVPGASGAPATADTQATVTPGGSVGPDGSTAPGASTAPGVPEGTVIVPPPLGNGVHRAGTVRVGVLTGRPVEQFDFDSGTMGVDGAFPAGRQPDLAANAAGLGALNGARFAPWTQPVPATTEGCAAVPEDQWRTSILLSALLPNVSTCVRTSDGRAGVFVTRQPEALVDGHVYTVYLDYTVWTKAGD